MKKRTIPHDYGSRLLLCYFFVFWLQNKGLCVCLLIICLVIVCIVSVEIVLTLYGHS